VEAPDRPAATPRPDTEIHPTAPIKNTDNTHRRIQAQNTTLTGGSRLSLPVRPGSLDVDAVAGGGGMLDDPRRELREVRTVDLGHREPDDPRATGAEVARRDVHAVPVLLHDGHHALAGRRADIGSPVDHV